jgi:hypothetical protein
MHIADVDYFDALDYFKKTTSQPYNRLFYAFAKLSSIMLLLCFQALCYCYAFKHYAIAMLLSIMLLLCFQALCYCYAFKHYAIAMLSSIMLLLCFQALC